jgi:hypothetical protein
MSLSPFAHPAFAGYFGLCRKNITPPEGIYARHWGAARTNTYQGVHHPLTLTAITFQDPAKAQPPLALVSLDFCVWRSPLLEGHRLMAAATRAGFPPDRTVLTLTHTHSAAHISPTLEGFEGGHLIPDYLKHVEQTLEQALHECQRNAQLGILETHLGSCSLATNRDLRDPNGKRFLVGWNKAGETDTTLLVGRITRQDGAPLGTLINYACHPTILAWENTQTSPDFLGSMREVLEKETGVPSLFLQGASGELAPRHQYTGNTEVADRAGRCLGYAVLSTLFEMQTPGQELHFEGAVESGANLAWWRERPRRQLPEQLIARSFATPLPLLGHLASAAELEEQIDSCRNPVLEERLQRLLRRQQSLGGQDPYPSPHKLWRLGDILLLSICHEAYSILQKNLRNAARPFPLLVATIASDGISSYLPPGPLYDEDIYTVDVTPFARGCLEQVIENATREIRSITS